VAKDMEDREALDEDYGELQETRIEELEASFKALTIALEARKQISKHRMETILSMLREIVKVIEVYVKD
jgi:hypothetical protein